MVFFFFETWTKKNHRSEQSKDYHCSLWSGKFWIHSIRDTYPLLRIRLYHQLRAGRYLITKGGSGGREVVVMWETADSAQCGAEWRSCVEWFQECIRSWGDNISVSDLGSVDPAVFHCVGVCLSVTCFHYWQTGHVEKHYPPSWQQVDVLPNVWRIPVEFTP